MGQPDYSPDDDSGRDKGKGDDYSPDDSGRDKRDDWPPTVQLQFGCNSDGERMR